MVIAGAIFQLENTYCIDPIGYPFGDPRSRQRYNSQGIGTNLSSHSKEYYTYSKVALLRNNKVEKKKTNKKIQNYTKILRNVCRVASRRLLSRKG